MYKAIGMQIYYAEERHYLYLIKQYGNLLFTMSGDTIFTFQDYLVCTNTCKRQYETKDSHCFCSQNVQKSERPVENVL